MYSGLFPSPCLVMGHKNLTPVETATLNGSAWTNWFECQNTLGESHCVRIKPKKGVLVGETLGRMDGDNGMNSLNGDRTQRNTSCPTPRQAYLVSMICI